MNPEEKVLIFAFGLTSALLLLGYFGDHIESFKQSLGLASIGMLVLTVISYKAFSLLAEWRKQDQDNDPAA